MFKAWILIWRNICFYTKHITEHFHVRTTKLMYEKYYAYNLSKVVYEKV